MSVLEKKIDAILIDFSNTDADQMNTYIKNTMLFNEKNIKQDNSTQEIYSKTTRPSDHNLIFWDIDQNPSSIISQIKNLPKELNIIITTMRKDIALLAFDAGVVDCLLKPVSYERFLHAAERAHQIIIGKEFLKSFQSQESKFDDNDVIALLKENYQLTTQEATMAIQLTSESNRNNLLSIFNITNQTLKQHLRSIYAKTIDLDLLHPKKTQGKMSELILFIQKLYIKPADQKKPGRQ